MMYRLTAVVFCIGILAGCSGGGTNDVSTPSGAGGGEQYTFAKTDSLLAAQLKTDSTARAPYVMGEHMEKQLLLWDAMEYYLQALTRDVKYGPAYGGLYRVFKRLDAPIMAADAARSCAELLGTDLEAWTTSADAYIDAGQFAEAQRAIGQAKAAGLPSDAEALLTARMELLRHDYASAEKSATVAVNSKEGRKALISYLLAHGYPDSAMVVSRARLAEEKTHAALMDYFFEALRAGHLYDARQAMAEMKKRDAEGKLAAAALVFYYDLSGEHVRGRDAATRFSEVSPLTLSSFAYIYQTASRTANMPIAGAAGDELMANLQVRNAHPIVKQFAIYKRIMPRARMMVPPEVVLTLDSITMIPMRSEVDFQAWYGYAIESVHKFKGIGDSIPTFAEFTAEWADHPALWTAFAATRMGFSTLKAAEAETLLTKVLTKDAHFKPAFDSLWVVYQFVGEFGKAVALCESYPHFLQYYPTVGLQKAISLAELGRVGDALAAAEAVLPAVGEDRLLMEQLTRSMVRRGGADKAMALLEKGLASHPENVDLLLLAGRVACDNGDCRRGQEYVDKGLALEPSFTGLLTEKGRILIDAGNEQEGFKLLEARIGDDPEDAQALIYLSRRLANAKSNADRAEDLARQAQNAGGLPLRASLNLSYVYLAGEKYGQARGAAATALKIYPNDPEALYLLGKALYNEKKPEAKEHLQKAVQLGITGDALRDAQAMLQRM